MPVQLHHIVIDAHDLPTLAGFWSAALGWSVLSTRQREVVIGPRVDAPVGLCFMPAGATRKTVKNRVHLDLTTTADDREAEIERLIGLGARRVDIGQSGTESWDVLADPEDSASIGGPRGGCGGPGEPLRWDVLQDPEGNEFCVFTPDP